MRTLKLGKNSQTLSPKESELLRMLCSAKDGILTRHDALQKIWGKEDYFHRDHQYPWEWVQDDN
jgi:DNA-binding response OmpR family regulator